MFGHSCTWCQYWWYIPELIEESVTGMKFESRNVEDLKEKISEMWQSSFDYEAIAKQSQERYNSEKYYMEIMKIYEENK